MTHPKALLHKHKLHASKKRGQNFLVQPATARTIALSAQAGKEDWVVEIGAGLGALTLALAELAEKVIAVEVDRGVFAVLEDEVAWCPPGRVEAWRQDALRLNWQDIFSRAGRRLVVAGNLPYAICSPLLFHLVENREFWKRAALMVQREVADRLLAGPGSRDYSRLTVLVKMWCQVREGMILGPDQFFPRPRVDSRAVHLEVREAPPAEVADPVWLSRVVKAAFAQRRKTLLNSLSAGLGREKAGLAACLESAGLDPIRRAETLTLEEFAALARSIKP